MLGVDAATPVRHGDLYFAFAPAYVPQPLSAEIGGTIRMQKSQWLAGAPACRIFSIVGNVQTGPAPITDPEHVSVGVPPAVDVGVVSANGAATDAGDRYVCTYAERQLPAGSPRPRPTSCRTRCSPPPAWARS